MIKSLIERLQTALGLEKNQPKTYKVPQDLTAALREAGGILWNTHGYRDARNYPGEAYVAAIEYLSGHGMIADLEGAYSRKLNEEHNDGLKHYIGFVDESVESFRVAEFRMPEPSYPHSGYGMGYPKNISLKDFLIQLNAGKTPVEIFDAVKLPERLFGIRLEEARPAGARVEGMRR
jgi:hypothetical protein